MEPLDPSLPRRPGPPLGIADRARQWIGWFGVARLLGTAVGIAAIAGAGYWLLRTPAAGPEAALPRATATTVAGTPVGTAGVAATAPPPERAASWVHVAGAVVSPGVHQVPAGARVGDAIAAAGGPTPEGDPDALNLAAVVGDGQRIYVPRLGEAVPPEAPAVQGGVGATAAGALDVNAASATELQTLPGIGPALAAAIVRHRDEHGPFVDVESLLDVPGIGPAKLEALRDLVTA